MRRLILAWILAALSVVGCTAYYQSTKTQEKPDPFALVCEALEAKCDFEPPTIITTRMTQWVGFGGILGGHIGGEKYVFIDPDGPNIWKTTLHEVVHYVAWQEGITHDRCESEQLAREVASALTGTEVDSTWAIRYGCTTK